MKSSKRSNRLRSTASEIHLETVRAFVIHYCGEMEFQDQALGAIRARDWKKLLQISDEVNAELLFAGSTCVPDTKYGDLRKFHVGMQFVALVGKYQYDSEEIPGLNPRVAAVNRLVDAERRNKRLNIVFATHRARGTERHWSVPIVREVFRRVLGDTPDYGRILRQCDFSGGASVSYTGDRTHLARKLSGEVLRGRHEALDYFREAVWQNVSYAKQFGDTTVKQGWSFSCDTHEVFARIGSIFEGIDYNKIEVVAKNAKSGRTIAKEGEVNNFCQSGIDKEIRRKIRRFFKIDLRQQAPNQQLAWLGSVFTDDLDPYVTLDVTDASNGVLREAIRSVTPSRWFNIMDRTRSLSYIYRDPDLPVEVRDSIPPVPYEMFCSMGNGFCFPLETLLFAAICTAAYRYSGMAPDFRCYGDDIIVRRSVALVVTECLRAFGFRLNIQKSFVFGPFRESCGANWYQGKSCTPGYYKEPVTCLSELMAQHNSLAGWPEVQAVLRSFAPKGADFFVPEGRRYGWVTDQAFRVPMDLAMTSTKTRFDRHYASWHFGVNVSAPVADEDWREGFRLNNPDDMVLTAVLRGSKDHRAPFHCRHAVTWRTSHTSDRSSAKPSYKTDDGTWVSGKWWEDQHASHVALWSLHVRRRNTPGVTHGARRSFLLQDLVGSGSANA